MGRCVYCACVQYTHTPIDLHIFVLLSYSFTAFLLNACFLPASFLAPTPPFFLRAQTADIDIFLTINLLERHIAIESDTFIGSVHKQKDRTQDYYIQLFLP